MSALRDAARGQECTVRVPGYCNFTPETVVLAHFRMAGICGTALKPIDLIGAHACSCCHDVIDGRVRTAFTHEQIRLMHLEGMVRTIDSLNRRGLLGKRK